MQHSEEGGPSFSVPRQVEQPINELPDNELPELNEADAEHVIVLDEQDTKNAPDEDPEDFEGFGLETEDPESNQAVIDNAVIVLKGHESDTLAVAASATNPNILISGGMDDIGIIWDIELQTILAKVHGANESVSTVAISQDGKYAALGSENGAISIVYLDGSIPQPNILEGPSDAINFFSWHPRGPVLLAGSSDTVAYMWNVVKGKFMGAFVGHEDAVTCGSFTSDGKLVITASRDSSVRVWNPTSAETIIRVQTGLASVRSPFHNADIHCMSVGPENTSGAMLVATGCAAGDVFISHRGSGNVLAQLPRHEGGVESIVFAPQGLPLVLLATSGTDGVVRVWDIEASTERCKFFHEGIVSKVVWHSSKAVLVSGSSEGTIMVWNVLSGEQVCKLSGHVSFISDICFTGDERFIASTSGDGTVRLFDIKDKIASI